MGECMRLRSMIGVLAALCGMAFAQAAQATAYRNFRAAIYIPVNSTRRLADPAPCERAVRLIARHFDQVILDDFFFYTMKTDADIAAKGNRSWTDYRVGKMREAARNLVLGPAHQENPRVQVIVKYPNWYEHFHGLGYDLADEAHMFDAIYTGTETRDPVITDQLPQQCESYEIVRYFSNIRPGATPGGWVA